MQIETPRLVLRPWREEDRAALAGMCADPEVMWDYGHVFSRAESDLRFDRYSETYARLGYCRWLVERDGTFIGHCGIQPLGPDHALGECVEIGWRLIRAAWGFGYASEAALAALKDGFGRCGMGEILSYTSSTNARSEAVMRRIGLARAAERDHAAHGESWVVYVGRPEMLTSPP